MVQPGVRGLHTCANCVVTVSASALRDEEDGEHWAATRTPTGALGARELESLYRWLSYRFSNLQGISDRLNAFWLRTSSSAGGACKAVVAI